MAKQKTYRVLQAKLDEVLEQLQSPELDIDKALKLYKHGQELTKQLQEYLQTAKNTIEHLKKA